jgi:arylsulfatase A-like enzyme
MAALDRRKLVATNGALLALCLVAWRTEEILALRIATGALELAQALLPELAAVVALECVWLVAGALARMPERPWRAGVLVSHALAQAFVLAEHQFFLNTGTRLDPALVIYAVRHAGWLLGLVGSGVDLAFAPRLALAALCVGLGWAQMARHATATSTLGAALPGAALLLSLGIVAAVPAPGGEAAALGARALASLAGPGPGAEIESDAWLAAHVLPIYGPPRVVAAPARRKPNVVLLVLESTRADAVPPWARQDLWSHAPFLRELAGRSVVFDEVYTTVPHTSKALVGILCGMYPVLRMPIVEAVPGQLPLRCLPGLLEEVGWRTGFFQTAKGSFEDRPGLVQNLGFGSWRVQEDLGDAFEKTGYFGMDEFAMLEPALRWIDENPEQPFFATLLSVTPHHPYHVPGAEPPASDAEAPQAYLRAIAHVDRFAAALHARLKDRGLLERTLFVVVGDHGEAFGEHLRRQHDVVPYEEGVRVPLYVAGPEDWIGEPRHVGGLRHHVDLVPTLLELLGVRWTGNLPGRDLFASGGHESVVASCWYTDYCMSLRAGDLKLVHHFGRRPTEVFDLANDPRETHDLAPLVPPALRDALVRQLLAYRYSVDAWYVANAPGRADRPIDRR